MKKIIFCVALLGLLFSCSRDVDTIVDQESYELALESRSHSCCDNISVEVDKISQSADCCVFRVSVTNSGAVVDETDECEFSLLDENGDFVGLIPVPQKPGWPITVDFEVVNCSEDYLGYTVMNGGRGCKRVSIPRCTTGPPPPPPGPDCVNGCKGPAPMPDCFCEYDVITKLCTWNCDDIQ